MVRLLITGACGFVGSALAKGLAASGRCAEIWGLDNFLREGSRSNLESLLAQGVKVVEGDIRRPTDLAKIPKVDWVIDCAAEPSVLAGTGTGMGSFELLDHNLIGTIQMLEFCKQHGAGFILMSTSRVYSIRPLASIQVKSVEGAYRPDLSRSAHPPGLSGHGIAESFPTDPPSSLYGTSKRCSELLALEYADAFGFPVWINRCGVLAGKGQFGKADQGIFSFWIRSWRERKPLKYIGFDGQGSQVRDCVHPLDLVPVLLAQLEGQKPADPGDGLDLRICNFGGGLANSCSLRQLSDWCEKRFGPREVVSDPRPRPFDLPWIVLDSHRGQKAWGWQITRPLSSILDEIAAS
jgi:CDP-paratose 2-epimerase